MGIKVTRVKAEKFMRGFEQGEKKTTMIHR